MANPVQQKSGLINTGGITAQTLNITLTSAVANGNSVVVQFAYATNSGTVSITSVTDNKGNTYTQQLSQARAGFSSSIAIYTALGVTNGPQTITIVTGNTVSATLAIAANVYEDTNTVLDSGATAHGTTTNSTAFAASFTTATTNESAYMAVSTNNGNETYTQNNGWTQGYNEPSDTASFYFYNTLSASGASSLNMTASTAVYDLWAVIALLPGTPSPPSVLPSGPMPRRKFILP